MPRPWIMQLTHARAQAQQIIEKAQASPQLLRFVSLSEARRFRYALYRAKRLAPNGPNIEIKVRGTELLVQRKPLTLIEVFDDYVDSE